MPDDFTLASRSLRMLWTLRFYRLKVEKYKKKKKKNERETLQKSFSKAPSALTTLSKYNSKIPVSPYSRCRAFMSLVKFHVSIKTIRRHSLFFFLSNKHRALYGQFGCVDRPFFASKLSLNRSKDRSTTNIIFPSGIFPLHTCTNIP